MSIISFDIPEAVENRFESAEEASRELRLAAAVKMFELGRISTKGAAQLTGLSVEAFLRDSKRYLFSETWGPPSDIAERIHRAAQALVKEGATEVYIFGSAAKGEMRVGSDVDMAVRGLPPERFFHAMGAAAKELHWEMDLVDLDVNTPFTDSLREMGELKRVA